MKGYRAVIRLLDQAGVDRVFTLMSGGTLHLVSELENHPDIDVVHTRHEAGATAMADGYSRATQDLAVCLVGKGPAVAQTAVPLVMTRKRGSKVLMLCGGQGTSHSTKAFEQSMFLKSLVDDVSDVLEPEQLVPEVKRAIRDVQVGDGPKVVQLPKLDDSVDPSGIDSPVVAHENRTYSPPGQPDSQLVDEAARRLSESERPPVLLAGKGAVRASAKESMQRLAQTANGLLATTIQAKGYFDEYPSNLGIVGGWGNPTANEHVRESDCLLAVGCSLNPYTTERGSVLGDETTIVHVDTDPTHIGRHTAVDVGIVGDARLTVEQIQESLERRGAGDRPGPRREELLESLPAVNPIDADSVAGAGQLDPRELIGTLDRILPDERLVVTGVGHLTRWIVDGVSVNHPDDFIWTSDFSAIGQAHPLGMGAALGSGGRQCYTFCGDFGFMMYLPELETAARHDIPVTIIVINDGAMGSEYHQLAVTGGDEAAALVENPDLATVAEDLGATGYTVTSIDELDDLSDTLRNPSRGPVVVDCQVDVQVQHRSMTNYVSTDVT